MAKAKANAEPVRKIELKPLNMKAKAKITVQVHLNLDPDTSFILSKLADRYGYKSQSKYLDKLIPLIFEQEYGFAFHILGKAKVEDIESKQKNSDLLEQNR